MRYAFGAALTALALAGCGGDTSAPSDALPTPGAKYAEAERFEPRGEVKSGYVFGRNGEPVRVTYEVHETEGVFEGDILLGPVEWIANSPEALRSQSSRAPRGLNLG